MLDLQAVAGILLSNATFSWLAWHYGLFDPVLLREAQRCPKFVYNGQKPAADLFEAWFGAVVVEYSFEAAMDWLGHIFCDAVCQGFDQWVRAIQDKEHERVRHRKINEVKSENGAPTGVRKHNCVEQSFSSFCVRADALLSPQQVKIANASERTTLYPCGTAVLCSPSTDIPYVPCGVNF